MKTRKSLLFLFCIYQRFRAEYSTGAGEKATKSPKYTTKILYWLRNDL